MSHGHDVLVVKNWLGNGLWSLPGGGIHRGETALQSVVREVCEETGIQLIETEVKSLYSRSRKTSKMGFAYQCFRVTMNQELAVNPLRRLEIYEARWIDRATLTAAHADTDVLTALQTS